MNAEFKALLGNATLEAILTTAGGAKIRLGQASQAWSKDGKVEKRDELSACIYEAKRGQSLPKGVVISKVEVTSSMPLKVRGAYWFSTSSFDHAKKGN